jgi:hypothetical protein
MEFTHKELLEVPCVHCEQAVGQPCVAPGNRRTPILGFHAERSQLRVKLPMIEMEGLDSTEKSLVMGYGFLILCDAVASKSMDIFGKQFSGREVQQFFAAKAIDELKKDGLIGKLKKKSKKAVPSLIV